MIFADIPAGAEVFIDANVFVYHFAPHPDLQSACQLLLERVSRGEIAGLTSADILSDVAHRLMTVEAASANGWPMTGIAYRLKGQPDDVKSLAQFRHSVEAVSSFGVQVVPVAMSDVLAALALSQQYGMLSGDALVVAVMQANGLTSIASHDADFDRVPGLTRYAPV